MQGKRIRIKAGRMRKSVSDYFEQPKSEEIAQIRVSFSPKTGSSIVDLPLIPLNHCVRSLKHKRRLK